MRYMLLLSLCIIATGCLKDENKQEKANTPVKKEQKMLNPQQVIDSLIKSIKKIAKDYPELADFAKYADSRKEKNVFNYTYKLTPINVKRPMRKNDFQEKQFDTVLCFGNTLVHLLTTNLIQQMLNGVNAILKPGGMFLMQILNYDYILNEHISELPI